MTLDCAKLCLGDWSRPLRLEVFDWDLDGGHDFIGACVTNLETLVQAEEYQIVQVNMSGYWWWLLVWMWNFVQLDLINPKKKEKKGYENSGQIVVKSVKVEQVKHLSF